METEGFAIYDTMMLVKNSVRHAQHAVGDYAALTWWSALADPNCRSRGSHWASLLAAGSRREGASVHAAPCHWYVPLDTPWLAAGCKLMALSCRLQP